MRILATEPPPLGATGQRRRRLADHRREALERMRRRIGGPGHGRVIVLFGGVLALDTADLASLGAVAGPLKASLHLDNAQLGLLAALPSLAAAAGTIPIGMLADRVRRIPILAASLVVWAVAMVLSGAASTFGELVVFRVFLGAATATAGPTIASLTGDMFRADQRGRAFGLILSGELIGSLVGLLVSGTIAGLLTWRAALWVLAAPSALLAFAIWRSLEEPARGGAGPDPATERSQAPATALRPAARAAVVEAIRGDGVSARPSLVLRRDPAEMSIGSAVRYVLRVPTNRVLIVSSALGYFFQAGVNTFGVVYVVAHFRVSQSAATLIIGAVALGALIGVVVGGRIADRRLRQGHASARMTVGGVAFVVASLAFIPGILLTSLPIAMLALLPAAFALAVPNAPLDAARLDVIPGRLWGRAEAVRTVLRTLAVASAPLLFGAASDALGQGAPRSATKGLGYPASAPGLRYTFLIMLVPMALGGLVLLRGRAGYTRDVATALASQEAIADGVQGGEVTGDITADLGARSQRGSAGAAHI